MRIWKTVILPVIVILVICALVRLKRQHAYLSSRSPDGRYSAILFWVRVFPYIQGVDCYLIVRDSSGSVRLKRRLLQNRDEEAEIWGEFTNLSWQGSSVVLEGQRTHYTGEAVIPVPADGQ